MDIVGCKTGRITPRKLLGSSGGRASDAVRSPASADILLNCAVCLDGILIMGSWERCASMGLTVIPCTARRALPSNHQVPRALMPAPIQYKIKDLPDGRAALRQVRPRLVAPVPARYDCQETTSCEPHCEHSQAAWLSRQRFRCKRFPQYRCIM